MIAPDRLEETLRQIFEGSAANVQRKRESDQEREDRDAQARESYIAYAKRTYPGYMDPPHVHTLAEALEWVERTPDARLIVVMPPGHSKSVNVSEIFPAYFMGRESGRRVISASHSAQLARRFSRRVRERVSSRSSPFGAMRVSRQSSAVALWEIEGTEGSYVAVGVGGSPAGLRADCMIIDDPIPNQKMADSPAFRETLWEWYRNTMRDRLAPGGRIIITNTRWHVEDLTGRLLEAMADGSGEQWRVLRLPALSEGLERPEDAPKDWEPDPMGRPYGEPLWPSFWSKARLLALKLSVGARGWAARFQGSPVTEGGNLLKPHWFPRYDRVPANATEIIQSWDTAYKTTDAHDYSVCITAAISPTDVYIVDVLRARLEMPDLQRSYTTQGLAWRPYEILVEDRASGTSLIQWARGQKGLPPTIAMPAVISKEARANDISPHIEAGRVHLPTSAPWLEALLLEIQQFPQGTKDQVDALAHLVARRYMQVGHAEIRSRSYMDGDGSEEDEDGFYG
jgi:predicted phage terminase large subunit-like protein